MSIDRWSPGYDHYPDDLDPEGDWVRYADVAPLLAFAERTASYMLWLRDCSDGEMGDGDAARAVARRLLGQFALLGIAEKSKDCGNGPNHETA